MNICIIGNSHVGALKRAWDCFPSERKATLNITFFAVGSKGMKYLEAKEGKLVSKNKNLTDALIYTSGGKSEIIPSEYDIFLLYGLFAKAYFNENSSLYTKAALNCALNDTVTDQLSFEVLLKLRSITEKKIYVGHNPFKASLSDTSTLVHDGYLTGLELLNEVVYKKYNSEILPQPLVTICNKKFTNPIYTKNSKKLATGKKEDNELHPEHDNFHMNDEFGSIWLSDFIKLIAI